ncbi:MAG: tRNA (adenosine(37)-N6)-threonylcarbamoyltransferase complex ATPase subunit type 1 TsaE [Clostridia bacterium]|nr:tRNA (adenosine(37)-N6)-threonylcarbamoyltransferase complex ATPase subunit type 1 TsaE [Clostridia bacterium]
MEERIVEEYRSDCERDTEKIAASLAAMAKDGEFYALYGDLGAGKTAFARGFVGRLIPEAHVSSPTYAILNVYRGRGVQINHFDTYRITSEDDLESTGFYEAIARGITLCEWPEKIPYALPDNAVSVRIAKDGESGRIISVERVRA